MPPFFKGAYIIKTLSEWLKYLENRPTYLKSPKNSDKMDVLNSVKALAEYLNLHKPDAYLITITGTNGKGSCAEMLTSVYHQAGYKVGTYTSPHLLHFNERIRIQRQPVSDEKLCEAFEIVESARRTFESELTYFGFITLAALWIFKNANIDVMILEVGIGGRLDATNILDADLSIITSIALDHIDCLGHTRELIAQEKAGIFRARKLAICGDRYPPQTLIQMAQKLDTHVSYLGKDFDFSVDKNTNQWLFRNVDITLRNLPMPILDISNAAIVLQAINILKNILPIKTIDKTVQSIVTTQLSGRCEIYKISDNCTIIFDVAHNPQAVEHLSAFIRNYKAKFSEDFKTVALYSSLKDKDIVNTIKPLKEHIENWHVTQLDDKRAASKEQLTEAFKICNISSYVFQRNLSTAVAALNQDIHKNDAKNLIVVFGSFVLVSDVIKSLNAYQ